MGEPKKLEDFTDDEIRAEFNERDLSEADDDNLSDYTSSDLIDELESRDAMPDDASPSDEVLDLIAEAARVSPHAARAYELLRDIHPEAVSPLSSRQFLIEGRMS